MGVYAILTVTQKPSTTGGVIGPTCRAICSALPILTTSTSRGTIYTACSDTGIKAMTGIISSPTTATATNKKWEGRRQLRAFCNEGAAAAAAFILSGNSHLATKD